MNGFSGPTLRFCLLRIAALATLTAGCARSAETDDLGDPVIAAVREELIAMGQADQQVREALDVQALQDSARLRRILEADSTNTRRLREIVREHGWPGKTLVGDAAAQAAFLIVQHSPSRAFQKEMLELLRPAAERGDAERSEVAMLLDRVRTQEGEPQLYGTQFHIRDDTLVPYAIADPAGLDARRADMGLAPMDEYVARLRTMYDGPVLFDTARIATDSTVR